jgi:hypothetical protein
MKNKLEQKYPCYYVVCAGMPCGPLIIPEQFCLAEEATINYVLNQMINHIKGRVIIEWGVNPNKKPTVFWRDKNGKPYIDE